jgi:hypothetical protein
MAVTLRKFKPAREIRMERRIIPYVRHLPEHLMLERKPMRTPFADSSQFEEKAATLAVAIAADLSQARQLLARLAGYDDPADIVYGSGNPSTWSSREELIARLLASRPGMADEQAAAAVDRLALPVRDADIDHIASSPGVIPNMGG